jgi:hypothetical protein
MREHATAMRSRPSLARRAGVIVTLVLATSCAGSDKEASSPNRPLPSYAGRATDLFDDSIEAAAVGLDFDRGYAPRTDPALRERTQTGDAVLRVRVTTVTSKTDGPDAVYELGLHTVEKLAGNHPPPTDFSVVIHKASESHGIMKSFETRLVGYSFIAFVREFIRPDGDREVHFHLAPDSKEVKLAVSDALAFGELK